MNMKNTQRNSWSIDAALGVATFKKRSAVFAALCKRLDITESSPLVFDRASFKSKTDEQRVAFHDEWYRLFCSHH